MRPVGYRSIPTSPRYTPTFFTGCSPSYRSRQRPPLSLLRKLLLPLRIPHTSLEPRILRHIHSPRRIPAIVPPANSIRHLTPLKSSTDPVIVLIALTIASVSGYIVSEFVYPPSSCKETLAPQQDTSRAEDEVTLLDMALDQPGGRPGNLTPEQELRLKELWISLYEVLGVIESDKYGPSISRPSSVASSPSLGAGGESPNPSKKKGRLSWLSRHSPKGSPEIGSESDMADDKHGLSKEFRRVLASQSKESIRRSFWDMTKNDNPDAILLRFLRARKWDVHDALVMMISAFHWRSVDMKVDDELVAKGEAGFLEISRSGTGTEKKDAADFTSQFHMGKSMVHGLDKENRPITIVRARLHHPGNETEKSLEMYTVFVIETARLMLRPPVDTATIIFDMTGFGLSNMDYAPVKFMIKCFEANYPESLGSILVYKAPWVFQGIWKIIRGWLDPVVASKIHFVSDEAEMAKYIDQPRMLKELGGDENWEYKYLEPVPGENDRMSDHKTRDAILEERRNLSEEYERLTLAWARENDKEAAGQRERLANGLRDNYWRLDPYVRARSLWDRTGIIGKDGALNFYPSSIPATTTTATTTTATTQHAPVVNGPSSTVQNHSPPQQHHHQHDGTADLHSRTALLSIDGHHAHGGDVDGASIYSDARSHIDEELD